MEKLLDLSKEIDSSELFDLVQEFVKISKDNSDLNNVFEKLNNTKKTTKQTNILNFVSALLEAIAIYNDFSSCEASVKKEMLQSCRDSTQFYLNRIIKEAKEKNENNKIEWARKLEEIIVNESQGGKGSGSITQQGHEHGRQSAAVSQIQSSKPKVETLKDPKIQLVGNVFYVENHKGNQGIQINVSEMQQRIVISNCCESVIQIRGKCTAISVENVNKVGIVVYDPIVSTIEILNSTRSQVQLNSICPILTVDNSESIQLFLGVECISKFELLTSKSNEINIYRQEREGEDYSREVPVPEQFRSYFDESGNLKTEAVRHVGA